MLIFCLIFYFQRDDDTYVFMDNLRKFISNKNSSIPVTYGFDYQARVEKGYHSGGAGYLLSKGAFSLLGSVLSVDYNFCPRSGFKIMLSSVFIT